MHNLKRMIAGLMVAAVVATSAVPAFAVANPFSYEAEADQLHEMGLFQGVSQTTFDPALDMALDRQTGIVMLMRIIGMEDEALAMTDAEANAALAQYTDKNDIADWAKKQIAHAVEQGLVQGMSATTMAPKANLNGKMYATMILRNIGYTVSATDYSIAAAILAEKGGLTAAEAVKFNEKSLIRDDLVGISFGSLSAVNAAGDKLIATLVDTGIVAEDAAVAAGLITASTPTPTPTPAALAVAGVNALNLKQFTVTFNKAVQADTIVVGNFTIGGNNAAAVALGTDNKTVTVTIADADVSATQPASYAVVVKNVKDAAGVALAASYSTTLKVFDNTIPVAQSVALTAPNHFTITFSEPIKTAGTVKVNNGVYGVSVDTLNGTNVVGMTLSASSLTEGTYAIEISGFKDYANFINDTANMSLNYVKDATLPVATIKSATQTSVVVEFNKAVTLDATNSYKDYFFHTFSAWMPDSVVKSTDSKTYTLTFNTYPIPAGTSNLTIKYAGTAGVAIVDGWANKLASNIVLPVTVVADATAPTVSSITVKDEQTVVITFSEAMDKTKAETEANYVIKDSTGTAVTTGFTATYAEDSAAKEYKVTLAFDAKLAGGAYTVAISGLEDEALAPNALAAVTKDFTITDLTPITVADTTVTTVLGSTSDDKEIIYVTYPEKMATTGEFSVLRAANYQIDVDGNGTGEALNANATLELFGSTGKVVKITLPHLAGLANDGSSDLIIGRVADAAGNVSTVFSFTEAIGAETAPAVTSVKQTDSNKVTITINKPLSVVLASGFTAGTGDDKRTVAAIDSWSIDSSNNTVILATLDAHNATSTTDTSAVIANFDIVANILVSEAGVKMGAADCSSVIADYRAPRLIADNAGTTDVNEAIVDVTGATYNNMFDIKFTEALDTTSGRAALMAQDLVITKVNADGTETALVAGVDYTTAINSSTNLRVTIINTSAVNKYTVKTKDAVNYLKDNSAAHNKATLFTSAIKVTVANEVAE